MEEYRIFFTVKQQGWYITQSNNLQQYDNWISSAPLGRCRRIINMNFFNGRKKKTFVSYKLLFSPSKIMREYDSEQTDQN